MKIVKTLSTLSLAFALQAGALVAAAVVLAPSDASADMMRKGDNGSNMQRGGNSGGQMIKKPAPGPSAPMRRW